MRRLLEERGVRFFAGVPDSTLGDLGGIAAADEGGAVALAAGHWLATGEVGCAYMQNSGLWHALNPLTSLCDANVYRLPVLLVIGWRGEPGVPDEPQHARDGQVLWRLLELAGIPAEAFSAEAIDRALAGIDAPRALIVRRGTAPSQPRPARPGLSRARAIEMCAESSFLVCTTGMASRELYEMRRRRGEPPGRDFLAVGGMGHASQIGLGVALARPALRIVVLDGDGALLMHLGALAVVGAQAPRNLVHVVLDNGAHASVGGQPTAPVDFAAAARACGYREARTVATEDDLRAALSLEGPAFVHVRLGLDFPSGLGRPSALDEAGRAFAARLRSS